MRILLLSSLAPQHSDLVGVFARNSRVPTQYDERVRPPARLLSHCSDWPQCVQAVAWRTPKYMICVHVSVASR